MRSVKITITVFVVHIFSMLSKPALERAIIPAFDAFLEPEPDVGPGLGALVDFKILRVGSHRTQRTKQNKHRWRLTMWLRTTFKVG